MVRLTHDGRRFQVDGHRGQAGFHEVLKWQMTGRRARWPAYVANERFPDPPRRVEGEALLATWLGHSAVLIQTAGLNILTDPFLSERASPLRFAGPKRVRPAAISAAALPPIDIVLLSHNHYDHMDLPALAEIARHHGPKLVTPAGNARFLRGAARQMGVRELTWGEHADMLGLRIHLVPALHWSKRSLFDANRALWGGFVVEAPGGSIYFAGDTGYGTGTIFADLHRRFGPQRLSLLPIGAYEPRWFMQAQHMNPEEAVMAHRALESRTSIAIHHGTIQLTDEPIDAPAAALAEALTQHSVDPAQFIVPDAGRVTEIG